MPLKVSIPGNGVSSRHLLNAHRRLGSHTQKMVTGKRVNTAADDAASIGVAANLTAQQTGTRTALRNIADGMSIVRTVEEATNVVADKIKRMRELAIQGSSDILENPERKYLQGEMQSLQDEMNRIAESTEFNGILLTNADLSTIEVQVGANNSQHDRMELSLPDLTTTKLFGSKIVGVKTVEHAKASIETLDLSLNRLGTFRARFGAHQNSMGAAIAQGELYAENMGMAASRVEDADYAHQSAQLARAQMVLQSSMAVRSQASVSSQAIMSLI